MDEEVYFNSGAFSSKPGSFETFVSSVENLRTQNWNGDDASSGVGGKDRVCGSTAGCGG